MRRSCDLFKTLVCVKKDERRVTHRVPQALGQQHNGCHRDLPVQKRRRDLEVRAWVCAARHLGVSHLFAANANKAVAAGSPEVVAGTVLVVEALVDILRDCRSEAKADRMHRTAGCLLVEVDRATRYAPARKLAPERSLE